MINIIFSSFLAIGVIIGLLLFLIPYKGIRRYYNRTGGIWFVIVAFNSIFLLLAISHLYLSIVSALEEAISYLLIANYVIPILALFIFFFGVRLVQVKEGFSKNILKFSILTCLLPMILLLSMVNLRFWAFYTSQIGIWWEGEKTENVVVKDETADWKTYQNEKYEFEMKIPEEWIRDRYLVYEENHVPGTIIWKDYNDFGEVISEKKTLFKWSTLEFRIPFLYEKIDYEQSFGLLHIYVISNEDAANLQVRELAIGEPAIGSPPEAHHHVIKGKKYTFLLNQGVCQDCAVDTPLWVSLSLGDQVIKSFIAK